MVSALASSRSLIDPAALPARTLEAWRQAPLAVVSAYRCVSADVPLVLPAMRADAGARIVFVNGVFSLENSVLCDGIEILDSKSAAAEVSVEDRDEESLWTLNDSAALCVRVADGVVFGDREIEVLRVVSVADGAEGAALVQPSLTLSLGRGAQARICVRTLDLTAGVPVWVNACTRAVLAEDARLSLLKFRENDASHLSETDGYSVLVGARARFEMFARMGGLAYERVQVQTRLAAAESSASVGGVMLARGDEVCALVARAVHEGVQTVSSQQVRAVLDGRARGVYQGCVDVREGANGTDGVQHARTVLLSPEAVMMAKPELNILTDDVRCGHGAVTGALDPEAMFYLRSRGIPEIEARALLLRSFVAGALAGMDFPGLADDLERLVGAWLGQEGGA